MSLRRKTFLNTPCPLMGPSRPCTRPEETLRPRVAPRWVPGWGCDSLCSINLGNSALFFFFLQLQSMYLFLILLLQPAFHSDTFTLGADQHIFSFYRRLSTGSTGAARATCWPLLRVCFSFASQLLWGDSNQWPFCTRPRFKTSCCCPCLSDCVTIAGSAV